jgi:ACS family glucarate transporter-like MFS transporter
MFASGNLWLMMVQYFGSNFTFFFSLTWLHPYVKAKYNLTAVDAGFYAMIPLLGGAVEMFSPAGSWIFLYQRGQVSLSRKSSAIAGFLLAALGMVMSLHPTAGSAVFWLTIAIFGADDVESVVVVLH